MLLNCKYCGGELEITDGATVTTCKYCRTSQTLPKTADEGTHNLFNRANNLRRRCDFDKAESLFEKIVEAEPSDPEAYWCLVLCKYGIEYVEDPQSGKMMPTCHRASYDSVVADEDYRAALEYADAERRSLYEEQAREIDRIQKDILALARNEESYDVFICYKETDDSGKRTRDSVTASEIYYELTDAGYKVFYAAITLEGKLGSEYEPIIFAALNSARVMLVVGSKPEYFNAVWVKNEWSRFLKIIKNDRKKLLIPCYRDMDAYDLPEEFAHLQAQDMGKIGFISDVIRGIKKIITRDEEKKTEVVKETVVKETVVKAAPAVAVSGGASTDSLLKRAFIFLEDGDFKSADEYCEKVLDMDPENAEAYLGKLMAENSVKRREGLRDSKAPFDGSGNYQRAVRYADTELKKELQGYADHVAYTQALGAKKAAKTESDYKKAAQAFKTVSGYMDAAEQSRMCLELAEKARLKSEEKKRADEQAKSIAEAGRRKKEEEARLERERRAEVERQAAKKRAKRKKLLISLTSLAVCFAILFVIALNTVIIPSVRKSNFISEYGQEAYEKYGLVAKGEYIKFGRYEQDGDETNGKEPIEWLVLDVTDGKALLVSRYGLDWKQFNSGDHGTWESSTIREWLNSEFLFGAFSVDERAEIPFVNVSVDKDANQKEANTVDRVFLLSKTDCESYLKSKSDRKCEHTPYAVARGAYVYKHNLTGKNNCIWWLRSSNDEYAWCIDLKGENDSSLKAAFFAVRPAIWVEIRA